MYQYQFLETLTVRGVSRVNNEIPRVSKLHEDARRCSKDFQQVWYELEMFKVCRDDMPCEVKNNIWGGLAWGEKSVEKFKIHFEIVAGYSGFVLYRAGTGNSLRIAEDGSVTKDGRVSANATAIAAETTARRSHEDPPVKNAAEEIVYMYPMHDSQLFIFYLLRSNITPWSRCHSQCSFRRGATRPD